MFNGLGFRLGGVYGVRSVGVQESSKSQEGLH